MANRKTGKIHDGPSCKFRCWAASHEARIKSARDNAWANYVELQKRTTDQMTNIIVDSLLPIHNKYVSNHQQTPIVRIHVGGEFFSEKYFLAWLNVAKHFKSTQFYAYTKALPFWVVSMDNIPDNVELNASRGGRFDHLIDEYKLKEARVVYDEQTANDLGMEIDHDDSHAYTPGPSFALLLHGTQPAGSDASVALQRLKQSGFHGYGKTSKNNVTCQ
tara:strand:+ start:1022 stop:1675 length:654 start_codon:yes stop_codon:yes gene_type:complete